METGDLFAMARPPYFSSSDVPSRFKGMETAGPEDFRQYRTSLAIPSRFKGIEIPCGHPCIASMPSSVVSKTVDNGVSLCYTLVVNAWEDFG